MIEEKRPANPDTDVVYLLSTQPHIIECFLADLKQGRYRRSHLLWITRTSQPDQQISKKGVDAFADLDPGLRRRIDSQPKAREKITGFDVLSIDFFPRESHLVTFRDPWSFPVLYHPGCSNLVGRHMQELAQKVHNVWHDQGGRPIYVD